MSWQDFTNRAPGDMITAAIWNQDVGANPTALLPVALEFFIDGGGAVITAGIKGPLEVPFKCDLSAGRLFADQNGTLQVDVWKDTYANYPPADADSITGGDELALSAVDTYEDTSLTNWTKPTAAGSVFFFNVDSSTAPASVTWCLVSLRANRS